MKIDKPTNQVRNNELKKLWKKGLNNKNQLTKANKTKWQELKNKSKKKNKWKERVNKNQTTKANKTKLQEIKNTQRKNREE